ncbi:MAG: hypothetical protein VB035_00705 [Candidatus Fimivivens sp.]|nr:hypothetical protein [Candidatus Fimivivens sp.]
MKLNAEIAEISTNDRNWLIGIGLLSFLVSSIAVYLCEKIPKPESIDVFWNYMTNSSAMYFANFYCVLIGIALLSGFLYRVGIIIKKAIESYQYSYFESINLTLLHVILIVAYSLISIVLLGYFAKYLFWLALIPVLVVAAIWAFLDRPSRNYR